MAGIKVVAALVRCAADLLLCDDIDTDHLRFADAEDCRNALPAIISRLQREGAPDEVVMGRCRFVADRGAVTTPRSAYPVMPGAGLTVIGSGGLVQPSAP